MKFAICNETYQGWPLEKAIAFTAETGYDAIEIAPFTIARHVTDISPQRRREIRQTAADHGLRISGIHWVLAQTEGLYLTHPEAAVRQKTSAYLCALVDCCADLGGEAIVVGSPKQRSLLPGVKLEDARRWAGEVFAEAVPHAGERGVTLCLEPLAPTETDFINTAGEAIDFVCGFDHPRFKIILDVKAMCSEGRPVPEIIRQSWPHFAYFHANDANLKGPGFGAVDFKPIAAALKEVGYDGFVSVEVFNYDDGPETIARRSLEYLRHVF